MITPARWLAWATLWGLALGVTLVAAAALVDHRPGLAVVCWMVTSLLFVAGVGVARTHQPSVACGRCGQNADPERGVSHCPHCDWWTNWPPTGRHAEVWARFEGLSFNDADRLLLRDTLTRWVHSTSHLVAYSDHGEQMDVTWPWDISDD